MVGWLGTRYHKNTTKSEGVAPHRTLESRFWMLQGEADTNVSTVQWSIPPGLTVEEVFIAAIRLHGYYTAILEHSGLVCLAGYTSEITIRIAYLPNWDPSQPCQPLSQRPHPSVFECSAMGAGQSPLRPTSLRHGDRYNTLDELSRCVAIVRKGMQSIPPPQNEVPTRCDGSPSGLIKCKRYERDHDKG